MSSPLITADEIIALRPCWLDEPGGEARIRGLVGPGVTAAQIAESTDVTVAHRRWILCHLLAHGQYASRERLARWAAGCAIDAARELGDGFEFEQAVSIACAETVIRWSLGQASIEEVWRDADAAYAYAYAYDAYCDAAAAYCAAAAADVANVANIADAAAAAYAADAEAADAAAYSAASAHLRELAATIDALREGREL